MSNDNIEMGRRLLRLPGIRIKFDAQRDEYADEPPVSWDRGTKFESVELSDPRAHVFTHYLWLPSDADISEDDEFDIGYYNAESWGEETATLGEQIRLVRERFPDQDIHIP